MKTVKVEMYIDVEDQAGIDAIKVWEHHVEYGIDTNSYPEIKSINGVTVSEVSTDEDTK